MHKPCNQISFTLQIVFFLFSITDLSHLRNRSDNLSKNLKRKKKEKNQRKELERN